MMKEKLPKAVFGICWFFLLVFWAVSFADYHYADHEGSNEYPYTSWETAAWLIQDAVDAASPHDTVYIGAGEWYQHMATEEHDSVAIIGVGTDSTFCYGDSNHNDIFYIDNGCSVEDITFSNYTNGSCVHGHVFAGVAIRNCKFINSNSGITASGTPTDITNCIFDSCGRAISSYVWVGDFYISNNLILNCYDDYAVLLQVESATVQNNIIINLQGADVVAIGGNPYNALIRNNVAVYGIGGIGTAATLKYNNVAKNYNRIPDGSGIGGVSGNSLFNNLTVGCHYGIKVWAEEEPCVVNYNAFWDNDVDIQSWGTDFDSVGNIFCNPMLISNDDFHLQAFSQLIDAGDPGYLDVDGTRSDIGAYGGPYGESYDYLDLPPTIPDSLSGQFVQDTIILNWAYNTEADFSNYLLHRDTITGFEPSVFNIIAEPETSYYVDNDIISEHNYYYRIASIDNQDNISDYSEELEVITTGIWGSGTTLPQITSIKTNYPNPFNTSTTIIYSVANLGPIPAEIEINIYDITGRKIRTLVNEKKDVGEYRVIWNGKDDYGVECSTGIYFARISQWQLEISGKPRKLVLVK